MSPDKSRVIGTGEYCLVDTDRKNFVFFVEDADSVTIDLRNMPGSQRVVAVDARANYEEKDMGDLEAGIHQIQLSRTSDWVIAVGDFDVQEKPHGATD